MTWKHAGHADAKAGKRYKQHMASESESAVVSVVGSPAAADDFEPESLSRLTDKVQGYRESDGSDEEEEVVLDDGDGDDAARDKSSGKGTPRKGGKGRKERDDGEDRDGGKRIVSYWTQAEKDEFLKLFKQFGRNWAKLSALIPGKTPQQIKNYFQNYKVKLNLIALLEEGSALDPSNPHLQVRYRRKRANKSEGDGDDSLDAEHQVLVCGVCLPPVC